LSHILPLDTKILRLDKDSARREGRMEEILDKFAAGEAQVLAGTQMLSKGHHFPGVTLVVAADGDIGLNLPDYRAAERTFQLLVQVSGRAGRGDKPGEVLIQTRNPNHYCWKFVRENDYAGFFEREKGLREKYLYPPFVKLGLVRMNYPLDYDQGRTKIMELARVLGRMSAKYGVRALGPAPSPLGLLRGRKRFQCLLKAKDWPPIRSVYAGIKDALSAYPKIRASLDLDPVNML
ncbi:MAG: helicase-related protein, partial [Thermodesulfobacteriota bacterium]|nr:helicase-related protein [Thermodesulfobacteriota bacterium]